MAPPIKLYKHQPLNLSQQQIRLLTILPKEEEHADRIRVEIEVVELQSKPAYTAPSYEWGSQQDQPAICIGDEMLKIGRNLYNFLVAYRDEHTDTRLWIDQISIDQDTTEERNHQVSLMSEIYSSAAEVIVWLGNDFLVEQAFVFAISLRDRLHTFPLEKVQINQDDKTRLEPLSQQSYWERHWIMQEVVLARECSIFCASRSLKLGDLTWISHALTSYNPMNGVLMCYELGHIRNYDHDIAPNLWRWAMLFCESSLCTDLRDKVFGIQSALPPALRIDVDYHMTARQVFEKAVFVYMSAERLLPRLDQLSDVDEVVIGVARLGLGMGLIDRGEFLGLDLRFRFDLRYRQDHPCVDRALDLISRIRQEAEKMAKTRKSSFIYELLKWPGDDHA